MKSSNDFQLFMKQLWEMLSSMFTAQIWGFSEETVLGLYGTEDEN